MPTPITETTNIIDLENDPLVRKVDVPYEVAKHDMGEYGDVPDMVIDALEEACNFIAEGEETVYVVLQIDKQKD